MKARGGLKQASRRHCASLRSTGHRSRARFENGERAAIEQKFTTQRENRFAVCQPARAFRQFMGSRALLPFIKYEPAVCKESSQGRERERESRQRYQYPPALTDFARR